jgi:hypothetical protein
MSIKLELVEPLVSAINHKITTTFIAGAVAVTSQTSPSVTSLNDIPITEIFNHELSALAWTMLIATGWIIVQFLNMAGVFKGIGWVWRRIRARND